ncbi:(Na+)-NQR maturation NqrM [Thauera sp. SDU_THAU2]|uniref:(Na+)-NQR maturation NqrM n=1 Tax=Thauera sp. SDU_THAU2 TaxID=3136633 RepID=UPI00311E53D2
MQMFLVTFGIIVLLVLLMAIGVLFGRKPIAGSCGGYKALDIECAAGCKNPCEKRRARMKAQAEAQAQAGAQRH